MAIQLQSSITHVIVFCENVWNVDICIGGRLYQDRQLVRAASTQLVRTWLHHLSVA